MSEEQKSKAAMREAILARRDNLDPITRSASSKAVVREVTTLPDYREARIVLAYAGFGSEIETGAFLRRVLDDGKVLLLPKSNRPHRRLDIYEVRDPDRDLTPGTWGILEPRPERCPPADPLDPDLILVPGVAFDAGGGRLGYGAGFYDRLLSRQGKARARLVAGAFELQMVEKVPMSEHDVPVDMVVTEAGRYLAMRGP